MALSAGGTIATCVVRWLYGLAGPLLETLKAILLAMIEWLDLQIILLRAVLAQFDIISMIEEVAWSLIEALFNYLKDQLLALPAGPFAELCPEFYQLLTDPAYALLDTATAGLSIFRERYKSMLSYMDEVDAVLKHWEWIKADLVNLVEVTDDAIYWAAMQAASEVP